MFQKAKEFLSDKEVTHMTFVSVSPSLPRYNADRPPGAEDDWHWDFARMGGGMFDWCARRGLALACCTVH
jgi:predicted dehydrogenase